MHELPGPQPNSQQLKELHRRLAELTTVQRVAQAINSTLHLDAIFQTVVTQIHTAFGYQMVSIYLREGDGLRLQAFLGYDEVMSFIRLDQAVSGRVARTGQAVFVNDAQADSDFIVMKPGTQQAIIVPLRDSGGQVLGTLLVESTGEPLLTNDDFTILTLLADQISVAIVNVQLFSERKRTEERLRRQNEELATLHATTLDIMNRFDQTSLLETIISRATTLFGTPHGYLYLLEPDKQEMVVRIGTGNYSHVIGFHARPGEGLAGHAWALGSSFVVADYATWSNRRPGFEWLHAAIATPLRAGAEIVGMLGLGFDKRDRDMLQDEVVLIERFADLASIALDNARLYAAAQQELAERKRVEAEQLALERKLLEAQKAESLTVLAGGIAHDFNNLLQVILGNTDLAMSDMANPTLLSQYLGRIAGSAQRAADLTRQLLAYAGKGRFLIEQIAVEPILAETVRQLQLSLPPSVALRYMPAQQQQLVHADATQIHQVAMNLIVNAIEALGEQAGTIDISTGIQMLRSGEIGAADEVSRLPAGEYLYIEVADTGPGMDATVQARMFEPFFTTKFTGRGLGLAAVQGIMRSHQGAVQVWSAPEQGARVRIWLRCASELRDAQAQPSAAAPPAAPQRSAAGAMVLVIDDENGVRLVAERMLRRAGFGTLTAADGRTGIELFRQHAGSIACVLLDLTMPIVDGLQVFQEIRQIQPDARIVLMSGYSETDATSRFSRQDLAGFLQKPFTPSELEAKIRQALATSD